MIDNDKAKAVLQSIVQLHSQNVTFRVQPDTSIFITNGNMNDVILDKIQTDDQLDKGSKNLNSTAYLRILQCYLNTY